MSAISSPKMLSLKWWCDYSPRLQIVTTVSSIGFESPALLFKVLSGNRWELLKVMTDAGPMSMREAARLLGRDVKGVHRDVHMLLNVGVLQKTDKGQIEFPFEAVHVDFMLKAA